MRSSTHIAWGWIAAGALGAALSALALLSVIFIGSNQHAFQSAFALAHFGFLPSIGIVVLGASGLGALLVLPTATPARIAHPALALALITVFGPVGWIPWLEGEAKVLAQGALAIAIIAVAVRYRRADARPGLIIGVALAAITLTPMVMYGAKSVEVERKARWHFAAEEHFVSALKRRAEEAAPHARALPDLYVIILEQHPSPRDAAERGLGYDEAALDALRARGWRISNDAQTNAPHTLTTFATMFSLSERLADGKRTKRVESATLNAHVSAGEIAHSRAFAAPLALDALGRAGFRREAWVGWWLPTITLRADAIDSHFMGGGAALLAGYLHRAWRREHGWTGSEGAATDESLEQRVNAILRADCKRFVAQRERLFAKRDRQGDAPRFALYHVYWIHDGLELDSEGSCVAHDALLDPENPGCARIRALHQTPRTREAHPHRPRLLTAFPRTHRASCKKVRRRARVSHPGVRRRRNHRSLGRRSKRSGQRSVARRGLAQAPRSVESELHRRRARVVGGEYPGPAARSEREYRRRVRQFCAQRNNVAKRATTQPIFTNNRDRSGKPVCCSVSDARQPPQSSPRADQRTCCTNFVAKSPSIMTITPHIMANWRVPMDLIAAHNSMSH